MRVRNVFNNSIEQKRISMVIILLISMIIFSLYIMRLNLLVNEGVSFELTRSYFIRFFNAVLSILGILSCIISYNSNKKKELFIVALMYTIFFIDIFVSNQIYIKSDKTYTYFAIGTSFIRLIVMSIAASNLEKLKNIIDENKIKATSIIVLVTFLFIYLEYKYNLYNNFLDINFIKNYNISLFIIYLIISGIFFIKSIVKKDYIYGVIGFSAIMFSIKSIYDYSSLIKHNEEISLTATSVIYMGFIIFIIGLFIELSQNIKMNRKLDEQRDLFFKIVEENEYSSIVICDEEYNIKYANKRARNNNLKAFNIKESKGDNDKHNLKFIHSSKSVLDKVEKKLRKDENYSESIYIQENDMIVDVSIQEFEKNNTIYKLVRLKDVSEKYKMEKALLEYENIRQQEQIKTEFFANISHELKTPLNIIYSTMQLLTASTQKSDFKNIYLRYKGCLDINCKRMLRLIDNIVDVTKFEVGYKVPQYGNYDIVGIVEGITTSVINYASIKNIEVIFDTDVEELDIKLDPDMMERVMLNLLSNAIKFSNKGGTILVDISTNKKWVKIKVKDEGIGIPSHIKSRVFDRFVQCDKSLRRENEGSGIGLSIVKSIIELMDGKIYLKSEENIGSEFIILLPNKVLKEYNQNKVIHKDYDIDIQRIQLEFSDIYELYNESSYIL